MVYVNHCSGCGAIPEGGPQPQACSLCRSEGLPPCYFCSEACLSAAWPHHREWHREQRRLHGLALEVAARHWSLSAAAPCSPYDELLAAMGAISGQSDTPGSHVHVGGASAVSGDVALAVATFLQAAEQHTDPDSLGWAERCIAAYALRSQPDCLGGGPPASWWTDAALVSLSARVVGARPDLPLAWRMRGEVLSARLGRASWRVGPRSAEELEEAGHALQVCTLCTLCSLCALCARAAPYVPSVPSAPVLHPLLPRCTLRARPAPMRTLLTHCRRTPTAPSLRSVGSRSGSTSSKPPTRRRSSGRCSEQCMLHGAGMLHMHAAASPCCMHVAACTLLHACCCMHLAACTLHARCMHAACTLNQHAACTHGTVRQALMCFRAAQTMRDAG